MNGFIQHHSFHRKSGNRANLSPHKDNIGTSLRPTRRKIQASGDLIVLGSIPNHHHDTGLLRLEWDDYITCYFKTQGIKHLSTPLCGVCGVVIAIRKPPPSSVTAPHRIPFCHNPGLLRRSVLYGAVSYCSAALFEARTPCSLSPGRRFRLKWKLVFCLWLVHFLWADYRFLDPCKGVVVLRYFFVILLGVDHIQRMGLPGDLIEAVSDGVELPHEKPIIRWRLVSRLKPGNDLPEISLPTETAFFNKTVKSFYFCITQSESNHIVSGPHFSSFRSWGLQGIAPVKPHLEHQMLCLLY